MVFSLAEWGIAPVTLLFIYFFLPLSLFVVYALPEEWRDHLLLTVSLGFFLLVAPLQLPLMLALVAANYLLVRVLSMLSSRAGWQRRLLFSLCLGVNLLAWISFSFQLGNGSLPYVLGGAVVPFLCIETGLQAYRNLWDRPPSVHHYLLHLLFFPRLFLGPFENLDAFWEGFGRRPLTLPTLREGSGLFLTGSFQFLFVGSRLVQLALQIEGFAPREITRLSLWLLGIFWLLGIYHVMAGISKITQGLGILYDVEMQPISTPPAGSLTVRSFLKKTFPSLWGYTQRVFFRPLIRRWPSRWMSAIYHLLIGLFIGIWLDWSLSFALWGLLLGVVLVLETQLYGYGLHKLAFWTQRLYTVLVLLASLGVLSYVRLACQGELVQQALRQTEMAGTNNQILYILSSNWFVLVLSLVFATDVFSRIRNRAKSQFPRFYRFAGGALQLGLLALITTLIV